VIAKYKLAAHITNKVSLKLMQLHYLYIFKLCLLVFLNQTLAHVVALCLPAARIAQVCQFGQLYMQEQLAAEFKKGQIEKGPAFPITICGSLE
jgi:hypothetical protein